MSPFIEKALMTYCDQSQTIYARQVAYQALVNAGLSDDDIKLAQQKGLEEVDLYIFLA